MSIEKGSDKCVLAFESEAEQCHGSSYRMSLHSRSMRLESYNMAPEAPLGAKVQMFIAGESSVLP